MNVCVRWCVSMFTLPVMSVVSFSGSDACISFTVLGSLARLLGMVFDCLKDACPHSTAQDKGHACIPVMGF
jgi:uncharacterized membrane protein required for colicin V production